MWPDRVSRTIDLPPSGEVMRRLIHSAGTAIPAAYLTNLVTWEQVQAATVAGVVAALLLELVRLLIGLEWVVFDRLTRGYEESNLAGYALYLIGLATVAVTFDPRIAVPAMLMLTIGDPIIGLLGSNELRTVKRPVVLVAMFIISFILAIPLVTIPVGIAGASVSTVADGVKPTVNGHVIDDNLTIPLGAATAMHLVREGIRVGL